MQHCAPLWCTTPDSCLERRIAVDGILCYKCRLSIYRNNSDKNSDCETVSDRSPSDATSDDPTFEVKVKSKEAVSKTEYFEIPIQRVVAIHKYFCICFSMKNLTIIPEEARIKSYIKRKSSYHLEIGVVQLIFSVHNKRPEIELLLQYAGLGRLWSHGVVVEPGGHLGDSWVHILPLLLSEWSGRRRAVAD